MWEEHQDLLCRRTVRDVAKSGCTWWSRAIAPASTAAGCKRCVKRSRAVIAKFVEIDAEAVEIQIETRNRETQTGTVSSAIQPAKRVTRRNRAA